MFDCGNPLTCSALMMSGLSMNHPARNHSLGVETLRQAAWKTVEGVGGSARQHWCDLRAGAAVIGAVLFTAVRPCFWTKSARNNVARQVMAVGLEPLGFVCAVATFIGISVVVQFSFWTSAAGQTQLLGPLLVAVVARELGPVLINLIVIVRSGSAMTTELGILKVSGEVRALEARGNDPFLHLCVPRVLGLAVSTFCLTIVFVLVTLASGYLFAAWRGKGSGDLLLFAEAVARALHPNDVLNILAKSIVPALFAGASCCLGGVGVTESVTEIPQAAQRALTRSIAGLFAISAVVSLVTYL